MTPDEILAVRKQVRSLEQEARGLLGNVAVANALLESAARLDKFIQPYCWGCGKILLPTDYGDHLCNGCIGGLPIAYPYE